MIRPAAMVLGFTAAVCFAGASFCEEPAASEYQHLFYLAEDRLVVLRVRVLIDGEDCQAVWRRHVQTLFTEFDKDGDGQLLGEETAAARRMGQLATFRLFAPGAAPRGDMPQYDKVTPDILAEYFRRSQAGPFSLQTDAAVMGFPRPIPGQTDDSAGVTLFERLDANADGKISREEFLTAAAALAKLDWNDDESIAAAELSVPSAAPAMSAAGMGTTSSPPVMNLSTAAAENGLAMAVLRRYNRGATAGSFLDNSLSPGELGIPAALLQQFDKDADDQLNLFELKRFVADPIPTLDIVVRLGAKDDSEPAVEIAPADDMSPIRRRGARPLLVWGRSSLEIAVRAPAAYFEQALRNQFRAADVNANEYLEQTELDRLPFYRGAFDLMDRDADGKVFEEELLAFGDKQAAFARVRVTATAAENGRNLFRTLDADEDARLARRELRGAAEVAAAWDSNGDGLEINELPSHVTLTFAHGQPIQQQLFAVFDPASMARLSVPKPTAGPVWFQRMDRNSDGEVSRREFLGPTERFRELDVNSDGWIDVQEAGP